MLRNRLHFHVSDRFRFPDGVFIDIIITQWKWCHTHSFVIAALETASFLRWRNRNWSHFQILFNLPKQISQKTITLFCEMFFFSIIGYNSAVNICKMQPWGWHHQHVSVPWRSIPGAPRLSYTAAVQLKKQANTNGSRGALCCLLASPLPSYLAHTEAFVTTSLLSIITLGRNNRKWLKKKSSLFSPEPSQPCGHFSYCKWRVGISLRTLERLRFMNLFFRPPGDNQPRDSKRTKGKWLK